MNEWISRINERKPGASKLHIEQVKGQNYQIACRRHFEVTHPGPEGEVEVEFVGNHPNAWFDASARYYAAKVRE